MTELTTIDTNNYAATAQLLGQSFDTNTKRLKLARLRIEKKAIMGETEVNGKMVKVEAVPAGSLALESPDGNTIFAEKATIRIFLQRFMYQKWDNTKETFFKSVLADSFKEDLKDTTGTFNCGKPSGFIEDWHSLPESMREAITKVKRVRVTFGTVTMSGVTKAGDAQDVVDIPFVWEVATKEGFKNVGGIVAKMNSLQRLLPQHSSEVRVEKREMSNGNDYYVPVLELDMSNNIDVTGGTDQDTIKEFFSYIENTNKWVLEEYNKNYQEELSQEDEDTVDGFIDVIVDEDE